jgi:TPP-dependent pyruvate/acetoin dehydrogenase alpha subunit
MTQVSSPRADARSNTDAASQLRLLEQLVLLREFDLRCEKLWTDGEPLIGEFHLSLGQEGFTVGTCAGVEDGDLICPSIRGMGVYLSRGVPMDQLFASFLERQGSISGGRWAHWHAPFARANILPQTGMLGAGLVMAGGVALAQKIKKTGKIVVGMLGDGASNTGYFHEGVNFAAVKELPLIIVIENNQIAVSTSIRDTAKVKDLSARASGYGIPGATVDATDVLAVQSAVAEAAQRARSGGGATLIELKAFRWGGQTLKDPNRSRSPEQLDAMREKCPIATLRRQLEEQGLMDAALFERMTADARGRIADGEEKARSYDPLPADPVKSLAPLLNVYAS